MERTKRVYVVTKQYETNDTAPYHTVQGVFDNGADAEEFLAEEIVLEKENIAEVFGYSKEEIDNNLDMSITRSTTHEKTTVTLTIDDEMIIYKITETLMYKHESKRSGGK